MYRLSELSACGLSCLLNTHPAADMVLDGHIQMQLQFPVEICLETTPLEQRSDTGGEHAQPGHLLASFEDAIDQCRAPLPLLRFTAKLPAASGGECVELCATVVLGDPPLAANPAALFEADERGVQGPLVEGQSVTRNLADASRDSLSMHRAE